MSGRSEAETNYRGLLRQYHAMLDQPQGLSREARRSHLAERMESGWRLLNGAGRKACLDYAEKLYEERIK